MDQAASLIASLGKLAQAEADCRRCPLYRDATQAVPGEGPKHATFMLVGEQPGDKEDLAGKPYVGPAAPIRNIAPMKNPYVPGRAAGLATPDCVSAVATCCMRLMSSIAAAGDSATRQVG
jgi:hypothetical protein